MFFALGFPHVVYDFIAPFDDMEAVEGDLSLGKNVLDASDGSMLAC